MIDNIVMKEFYDAVSNFGFPIVIAGYLLFRFEGKLDRLEDTIQSLTDQISKLTTIIENKRR